MIKFNTGIRAISAQPSLTEVGAWDELDFKMIFMWRNNSHMIWDIAVL